MKTNNKNKIEQAGGKIDAGNPKDRMANLVLLVGLMGCFVFYQYFNWNALAKEAPLRVVAIKENALPKMAPKKEIMADNGLRCEVDDAGKKDILAGKYSIDQFVIKQNIEKLVGDKPMENMTEAIATRNSDTASYLVAIAKHESNLGKFSPKKDGKDCFNYWGYRGTYNQTKSGYSCFDSPEQAVSVVGNRIQALMENENITTPEEMLIWKCGGSCAGHDPADVDRWQGDVDFYFKKINSTE